MGRHRWAGPAQGCGRTFILCFSIMLCILSNGGEIEACTKAEADALLQFKARIINSSSSYLADWIEGSDCCVWRGVECGVGNISVTRLSLGGAELQGPEFKARIINSSSSYLADWIEGSDCCVWRGVECGVGNISVTRLSLGGAELQGPVIDSITSPLLSQFCALHKLQFLDASSNQLGGTLPECFGNLTDLAYLTLYGAGLTGMIPSSIGNLSLLTFLDLSGNQLVGSIPDSLGYLAQLTHLHLYDNKLGGVIPASLGQLPVLEEFMLQRNRLTGSIPSSLGNISAARGYIFDFLLTSNDLSGSIPASIGNLSVASFSLADNNLTGPIPSSFQTLTGYVFSFFLEENSLTGSIPQFLIENSATMVEFSAASNLFTRRIPDFSGNNSGLISFNLSYNNLRGPIPTLPSVGSLDLSENALTGTFPSDMFQNFTDLQHINLRSNKLIGMISGSYEPQSLEILILTSNRFSGDISTSFGNLTGLKYVDLSKNSFSGHVPSFHNSLTLENMKLGGNSFDGAIPASFSSFRSLQSLHASQNRLTDTLPSLRNCPNLTVVDVSWNQLSGPVPSWLEGLSGSLRVLMLGSNRFAGPFPAWLGSLLNLQVLDISNNMISGTLPADLNRLEGYRKDAVNDSFHQQDQVLFEDQIVVIIKGYEVSYSYILSSVTSFDVSHNELTGPIPSELGDLTGLRYFNLTSNKLSGAIPSSLGAIVLLESLDLSSNDLTGSIPSELTSLKFLSFLNVSSNQLSGQIPQGFQFSTFSNSSYLQNSGLCGYPLEQCLPQVPKPTFPDSGRQDSIDNWISLLGLLVGFMMGFLITWVFIIRFLIVRGFFLRFKRQGQPTPTSYGAYNFP